MSEITSLLHSRFFILWVIACHFAKWTATVLHRLSRQVRDPDVIWLYVYFILRSVNQPKPISNLSLWTVQFVIIIIWQCILKNELGKYLMHIYLQCNYRKSSIMYWDKLKYPLWFILLILSSDCSFLLFGLTVPYNDFLWTPE